MNKLLACANQYLAARDWKMAAALKFCLGSLGLLLGMQIPPKRKKAAAAAGWVVFLATYIPLMTDFLCFCLDFFRSREKSHT